MNYSIIIIGIIFIIIVAFILVLSLFSVQENLSLQSELNVKVPDAPPQLLQADNVRQMYRLNRIYPLNGSYYYDVGSYPDVVLPGEVVGCGGRREPCYGGSQQVVANLLPPLNITDDNIAPTNGSIGAVPPFMEVGYLYKVFAPYAENAYRPLYLNKVHEKDGFYIYNYFTIDGNERRKVFTPSKYRQLGTNDQVTIEGEKYFYRVTINENNFPSYPRINEKVI